MVVRYSRRNEEIDNLIERLKALTLAFTIDENTSYTEESIIDGSKSYNGIVKMNAYIDKIDSEKEKWYYCNC